MFDILLSCPQILKSPSQLLDNPKPLWDDILISRNHNVLIIIVYDISYLERNIVAIIFNIKPLTVSD